MQTTNQNGSRIDGNAKQIILDLKFYFREFSTVLQAAALEHLILPHNILQFSGLEI